MAGISEAFIGADTKIHITATLGAAIISDAALVPEIAELGEVALVANIIEFNAFGKAFKEKRVGKKESGELELTLNWVPSDAKHTAIKAAFDAKTSIFVSIVYYWGADNARVDFEAYVGSFMIETPIDDIVKAKVKLALTGSPVVDAITDITLNY